MKINSHIALIRKARLWQAVKTDRPPKAAATTGKKQR